MCFDKVLRSTAWHAERIGVYINIAVEMKLSCFANETDIIFCSCIMKHACNASTPATMQLTDIEMVANTPDIAQWKPLNFISSQPPHPISSSHTISSKEKKLIVGKYLVLLTVSTFRDIHCSPTFEAWIWHHNSVQLCCRVIFRGDDI